MSATLRLALLLWTAALTLASVGSLVLAPLAGGVGS